VASADPADRFEDASTMKRLEFDSTPTANPPESIKYFNQPHELESSEIFANTGPQLFGEAASYGPLYTGQSTTPAINARDDVPWQRYTAASKPPIDSDLIRRAGYDPYASIGSEQGNPIDHIGHSWTPPFGFAILNPTRSTIPEEGEQQPGEVDLTPEDSPFRLAQALFPPISLFAKPPIYIPRNLTPLEQLPRGSANGPRAGKDFLRNEGKPKTAEEYPKCTYCGEQTAPGRFHRDHIIPR
jgi:hypothetical protein